MLDHLTTDALAAHHRAALRRDAHGLRQGRLHRLRKAARRADRSPTDQR
jgi:hypothetical protein